jgi:hypothetical protein
MGTITIMGRLYRQAGVQTIELLVMYGQKADLKLD